MQTRFHMAIKKNPSTKNEEKDLLGYTEHMALLRQIIRLIIRKDSFRERQGQRQG